MKKLNLELIAIPLASLAIGVAAQLLIKLPDEISVAPITGQSLAILLIAELMRWKNAGISVLLYLLLAALGAPLLADFQSGWEVMSGKTAGFFIGFLLCAIIISYWSEKGSNKLPSTFIRLLSGSLIILSCGYIGLLRYLNFSDAFKYGVLPFLPGALVKIFLAIIIIGLVRRFKSLMKKIGIDQPIN